MKTVLVALSIFFFCKAYTQTILKPGDSIAGSINRGDSNLYKVKTTKGNLYKIVVVQNGIDLEIILKRAGNKDSVFDSPNGISGPEPVEFVAKANGYALLNVRPLNDSSNSKTGQYTIQYTS